MTAKKTGGKAGKDDPKTTRHGPVKVTANKRQTEQATTRTTTVKVGPAQLTTKTTAPRLTTTRTKTIGRGRVQVTGKLTTPRLPNRTGRYTLPLADAVKLMEAARNAVTHAVDELRGRASDLEGEADAVRQQAADAYARWEGQHAEAVSLTLAANDTRGRARQLAVRAGSADVEASRLAGQAEAYERESAKARQQTQVEIAGGSDLAEALALRAEQLHTQAVAVQQEAEAAERASKILAEESALVDRDADAQDAEAAVVDDAAYLARADAERLNDTADQLTDRTAWAQTVSDDTMADVRAIDRRINAARGGDDGAAIALDQAAQMVLNAANRIDGLDLTGESTTNRARQLAVESRK